MPKPDDPTNPGAIQAGNISHSTVAIGHGASATVINQLVQGLGDLPTRYDGQVRSFLEYYCIRNCSATLIYKPKDR